MRFKSGDIVYNHDWFGPAKVISYEGVDDIYKIIQVLPDGKIETFSVWLPESYAHIYNPECCTIWIKRMRRYRNGQL